MDLAKAMKVALENTASSGQIERVLQLTTGNPQYQLGEQVTVHMPGDVTGKNWKFGKTLPWIIQYPEFDTYQCRDATY